MLSATTNLAPELCPIRIWAPGMASEQPLPHGTVVPSDATGMPVMIPHPGCTDAASDTPWLAADSESASARVYATESPTSATGPEMAAVGSWPGAVEAVGLGCAARVVRTWFGLATRYRGGGVAPAVPTSSTLTAVANPTGAATRDPQPRRKVPWRMGSSIR